MRRRGISSLTDDQAKAESIRFVLAVKGLRSLRDALCAPLTAPERMLMSFLIDRSSGLCEKPQTSHYPMKKCNPCHRFKVLPMFQVAQCMELVIVFGYSRSFEREIGLIIARHPMNLGLSCRVSFSSCC